MLRGCFKKKDHENWSTGSKVIKQFCHKNTVVGLTWSSMLPCLLFWDIITQQTMTSRRHFFSGGAAIWMAVMQKLQGRQVHNLEIIISGQVAVELFAKNYQNIVRKKVHFKLTFHWICTSLTRKSKVVPPQARTRGAAMVRTLYQRLNHYGCSNIYLLMMSIQ